MPGYDPRFIGFGWNKVSHIYQLNAQGAGLFNYSGAHALLFSSHELNMVVLICIALGRRGGELDGRLQLHRRGVRSIRTNSKLESASSSRST